MALLLDPEADALAGSTLFLDAGAVARSRCSRLYWLKMVLRTLSRPDANAMA
jgi:hypothetical protein